MNTTERTEPTPEIIGIDPGCRISAVVRWQQGKVAAHMVLRNADVRHYLRTEGGFADAIAVENVSCFGMAVGAEVFDTVRSIGRLEEICRANDFPLYLPARRDVCMHHCRRMGGDSQMRAAMIERLGAPGTKKAPGITYGIRGDEWSALAVALFGYDMALAGIKPLEVEP